MVVYEEIGDNLIKAYSSDGKMLSGGFPAGLYPVAYDPIGAGRTYVETNEYVPTESSDSHRTFSRLYLELEIAKLNKIDEFDALLKSIEIAPGYTAYRAFERANEISEDFPNFSQYVASIKTALGLTDQQVENALQNSVMKVHL